MLWLNRFDGMDIRCVRLAPYELNGRVLLDIQQVIPLPEAAEYQVQVRRKDAAVERASRADRRDFTRYHVVIDDTQLPAENRRNAIRAMVDQLVQRGVQLADIRALLPKRMSRVLDGQLVDGEQVRRALDALQDGVDVRRWFTDHAWYDGRNEQTYVLFKMWCRGTLKPPCAPCLPRSPAQTRAFRAAADDV